MKRKQIGQLIAVMKIVQAMLAEAIHDATQIEAAKLKRRRGEALAEFHRAVAAARKAGAPVPEIARKYGVSESHIYRLVSTKLHEPPSKRRKLRSSSALATRSRDRLN